MIHLQKKKQVLKNNSKDAVKELEEREKYRFSKC